MRTLLALATGLFCCVALADSWRFDPVLKQHTETFGNTKIVMSIDARKNQGLPDFSVEVYANKELRARYRGVSYQKLFASPDKSLFLGLSNDGLPGTAVVLFDKSGNLLLEVKHAAAAFDYCVQSMTRLREWFDADNPAVKFVTDAKYGGYKSITLRDCRGNEVDLQETISAAYGSASKRPLPPLPN